MPFLLIFVGLFYWLNFVIRAWSVSGNVDNYSLVMGYTQSAIFGLWLMVAGGLWLLLRKR
jgi:hypothetical protein